jgi:hypothetical protein
VPKVVVVALLLVWLVWRTLAGTIGLLGELVSIPAWIVPALTLSEDERIARTLEARDEKLGVAPGYHHALYRAVVEHVPPDGTLLFDVRTDLERAKSVIHLGALAFPRLVLRNRARPDADLELPPRTYVLTFDEEVRAFLQGRLRELATGPDWSLWGP